MDRTDMQRYEVRLQAYFEALILTLNLRQILALDAQDGMQGTLMWVENITLLGITYPKHLASPRDSTQQKEETKE